MKSKAPDEKFCTECGEIIKADTEICHHCGVRQLPPRKPSNNSNAMNVIIPINRSKWAVASGYFGLLSILVVPAPLAIITGFIALKDIKKHPEKLGANRAKFGIAIGAFFIIVYLNTMIR